jgi:hypothetical protein
MSRPIFEVRLDKTLDEKNFIEFFLDKNSLISDNFPDVKTVNDVRKVINFTYKSRLIEIQKTKNYIESQNKFLNLEADELSKIIECSWDGIKTITIVPAVCPVAPRFLNSHTFMVPFFYDDDSVFRICCHEMSHFLYFKKLKLLFPDEKIDTEYPGKDWLLSEIVTPLLINDHSLQQYIGQTESFYSPTKIENIEDIAKTVEGLYKNRINFGDFVKKSREYITRIHKKRGELG